MDDSEGPEVVIRYRRQLGFDPGADFELTHLIGRPTRVQQRFQGQPAGSINIGSLGQFDDGVNIYASEELFTNCSLDITQVLNAPRGLSHNSRNRV